MARGWQSVRRADGKNAMAQGALHVVSRPGDLSKIYSWRGLHATWKKTHVDSPNRGPAAKCSSSSKAARIVSSSGVVHAGLKIAEPLSRT